MTVDSSAANTKTPKLLPEAFESWQYPAKHRTSMDRVEDSIFLFVPARYLRSSARGWQDFNAKDRMATLFAMAIQFMGESIKFSKRLGTNPGMKESC